MVDSVRLSATDLIAGYPGREQVLKEASIEVPPGARVVLLGANGCGKTTLMRCLSGAMRGKSGDVCVDGVPLADNKRALRAHRSVVQLVLQDPDDQLFSADVTQDVSFGPMNQGLDADTVRARVEEALALLGVTHLAERATHHLSYGERKRVATAGAVAMRPAVLLLDEPTAGLDARGIADMVQALERLNGLGTGMLIATHDIPFALDWADQAAIMLDGVITQGPVAEVLADADLVTGLGSPVRGR